MGGSDDLSNLVELSIEDHAEEHKWLFIEHGKVEDAIAWLALSGQLTDASQIAYREGIKNRDQSFFKTEEYKQLQRKLSLERGATPPSSIGLLRREESKRKQSMTRKELIAAGVIKMPAWTNERRQRQSERLQGNTYAKRSI